MLYVFGDSFTYQPSDALGEKYHSYPSYLDLISSALQQPIRNYSVPGASNEFIYHKLIDMFSEGKPGESDYIIVATTFKGRRWLLKDHPELSNFLGLDSSAYATKCSKEQSLAVRQYVTHLQHEDADNTLITMFLHALHFVASQIKCRMLILPGFHYCPGVIGTLNSIGLSEFDNTETRDKFFKLTGDYRPNHMLQENHNILAGKILGYFKTGNEIDLTTDFKTNLITKENLKEYLTLT